MAINLQDRLNRGREIIADAGPSKVALGGVVLAAATAILLFLLFFKGGSSYEPLYPRLTPEDAGAITAELKTQKVPYKLSGDGTVIEVPADQLASTRLDLAVKGLPSKGNVGYEIFDKQKLGTTELVQKTNLMRAVTGELERTISSLAEVESAKVILQVPKEVMFVEEQKPPTASVVIKLRPGAELSKGQLMGIVHLVTASVSGLTSDNVSVVDYEGGLIWSKELNKIGFLNDDQLKQKARYEDGIKRRIQSMMERVVGPGRVVTTVNADLDLKEVITNEDIYDPERSAVRSEQRVIDRSTGPGRNASGVPNATYELGTANRQNSGAGDGQEMNSRTEETNNYEVTNIKRQIVSRAGDLKKISVSVILDGVYTENEAGEKVFTPQPDALLAQLEDAVKAVIGFDEKRGDIVSISSVQFPPSEEISVWVPFIVDLLREFARPFLNMVLIILFFFLVVRPLVNWLKKEVEPLGSGAEPPILPDMPGGGSAYSDTLPVGTAAASEDGRGLLPALEGGGELDRLPERTFSNSGVVAPNYDEEGPETDDGPAALTYGNLSRENILPLARDNLDRTVGLVRGWIEDKPE